MSILPASVEHKRALYGSADTLEHKEIDATLALRCNAWVATSDSPQQEGRMARTKGYDAGQMGRLVSAVDRVGRHRAELIDWLEDFARLDLGTASHASVALQAQAFMERGFEVDALMTMAKGAVPSGTAVSPIDDHLGVVQTQLREMLSALRDGRAYHLPAPPNEALQWLPPRGEQPGGLVVRLQNPDPVRRFFTSVAQVLMDQSGLLRICDARDCDRFFVPRRPHQVRCSLRCTSRESMRRQREKPAAAVPKTRAARK